MVDWRDPEVESRISDILVNLTLFLVGLYGWEYVQSFQVEYALLRRRLSFRWPLIPYVAGRLCFLTTVIMLAIITSPTPGKMDCTGELFTLPLTLTGNAAIGCASTNLMIRTWLIWRDSRPVLGLLSLVAVGHWTILALGLTDVDAFMSNGSCDVVYANHTKTASLFIYTMFYDMLVFLLTIVGLSRKPSASALWKRLYRQGVVYFAITFLANIVPMV
ncbi:hypothetical protein HYDPIDRAFT_99346 [Hydnomerulius pinastri MD-312]|uniref:Uncharacterized protein n=1 Tax=Hydnomerulius pinastri MD-312 TaxID=994086 RepID=A0A0C9W9W9_9AGAM|nr:hypothetical protein HYDPIDRAFT_99346 [Hydnomerulius pinastri MD-312]